MARHGLGVLLLLLSVEGQTTSRRLKKSRVFGQGVFGGGAGRLEHQLPKQRLPLTAANAPTAWLIGASKCATSSIGLGLSRVPGVCRLDGRGHGEAHVFDNRWNTQRRVKELGKIAAACEPGDVVVEYTPEYLFESAHVPQNICRLLRAPGVGAPCAESRFVVMLREPVKRTVSSWLFKTANGGEKRPFAKVVDEGIKLAANMSACHDAHMANNESKRQLAKHCAVEYILSPPPHSHRDMISHSHVGKSMYAIQLIQWFAVIPKKNFLVVLMEEYYEDPEMWFSKIVDWMRAPALASPTLLHELATLHANPTYSKPADKAQVTPELLDRLRPHFFAANALLDKVLGRRTGYPTHGAYSNYSIANKPTAVPAVPAADVATPTPTATAAPTSTGGTQKKKKRKKMNHL